MAIRPKMVGETIRLAIEAGAVGCRQLEDSFPPNGKLRDPVDQCRSPPTRAADGRCFLESPFFINARTDVFFQQPPEQHVDTMVVEALERARAYADRRGRRALCARANRSHADRASRRSVAAAVNIMVDDATPPVGGALAGGGGSQPWSTSLSAGDEERWKKRRATPPPKKKNRSQ